LHHHLDIFVIFEAVADDGSGVVRDRHYGEKLGLRTRFQAESIGTAVFENFFHYLTLLIYLDGEDATVLALVTVLSDGALEGAVNFTQAVFQNFTKPQQDGRRNATKDQLVEQLLHIDLAIFFLIRVYEKMPILADGEVSFAP